MEKKRVAMLISGQFRSIHPDTSIFKSTAVEESIDRFLLTEEFISKYEIHIFLSTDPVSVDKVLHYFGKDLVKNIHFYENRFFLHPIENHIAENTHVFTKYYGYNHTGYQCQSQNSLMQQYRFYDVFNLAENYRKQQNLPEYDFYIRARPDNEYIEDVFTQFNLFDENPKLQLVGCHDFFGIGKPDIMRVWFKCFDFGYGNYNRNLKKHEFKQNILLYVCREPEQYYGIDPIEWTYAPEIQLMECLFDYCERTGVTIDETMRFSYICHI